MIEYIFQMDDGESLNFKIHIDREYIERKEESDYHFWTELIYHQCDNCTLSLDKYRYCPAAADLQDIIDDFSSLISYVKANVIVKTPEREYRKTCDIQTGLQSVLGLVMATSACPILSKLKPLANFHLPFATTIETLFRSAGAYLIQQYFIYSDGGESDFKLQKLELLYYDLEKLNTSFSNRIRAASQRDANLGAIVQLGALSFMVRASLKDQLSDFRPTFEQKLF